MKSLPLDGIEMIWEKLDGQMTQFVLVFMYFVTTLEENWDIFSEIGILDFYWKSLKFL